LRQLKWYSFVLPLNARIANEKMLRIFCFLKKAQTAGAGLKHKNGILYNGIVHVITVDF